MQDARGRNRSARVAERRQARRARRPRPPRGEPMLLRRLGCSTRGRKLEEVSLQRPIPMGWSPPGHQPGYLKSGNNSGLVNGCPRLSIAPSSRLHPGVHNRHRIQGTPPGPPRGWSRVFRLHPGVDPGGDISRLHPGASPGGVEGGAHPGAHPGIELGFPSSTPGWAWVELSRSPALPRGPPRGSPRGRAGSECRPAGRLRPAGRDFRQTVTLGFFGTFPQLHPGVSPGVELGTPAPPRGSPRGGAGVGTPPGKQFQEVLRPGSTPG